MRAVRSPPRNRSASAWLVRSPAQNVQRGQLRGNQWSGRWRVSIAQTSSSSVSAVRARRGAKVVRVGSSLTCRSLAVVHAPAAELRVAELRVEQRDYLAVAEQHAAEHEAVRQLRRGGRVGRGAPPPRPARSSRIAASSSRALTCLARTDGPRDSRRIPQPVPDRTDPGHDLDELGGASHSRRRSDRRATETPAAQGDGRGLIADDPRSFRKSKTTSTLARRSRFRSRP